MRKPKHNLILKSLIFVLCGLLSSQISGQDAPKYEMRAAWVATVNNLDFPSSKNLTTEAQRIEFIRILDQTRAMGINAVVVQIRSNGDALYFSASEPWAEQLTGLQGRAPTPFYDPLVFMVEEAHKRGLEFHAWFNPYRAVPNVNTAVLAANHVATLHPEWLLSYGNLRVLNPGLEPVRDYLTRVILEVVQRYDIDGVHFDDYFYPYPQTGLVLDDASTFAANNRGILDRGDWRRDNINLLIKQVSDSIVRAKPWVKFGISPFGIWQNRTSAQPLGSETRGLQSYSDIFADSRKWAEQGWVDYLTPQLYWNIGLSVANYELLVPWWAQNSFNRHLYIGQGVYKIGTDAAWNAAQMPTQLNLNRSNPFTVRGSFFYRTLNLNQNLLGFRDSLKNNFYKFPAMPPRMDWKDQVPPPPPLNLTAQKNNNVVTLSWTRPTTGSSELEKVRGYVLYRFKSGPFDISKAENIRTIVPTDTNRVVDIVENPGAPQIYAYVVTAFDRLYNESAESNAVLTLISSQNEVKSDIAALEVSPNPVQDVLKIDVRLYKTEKVRITWLDYSGRVQKIVFEGNLEADMLKNLNLEVSEFAKGIYFLKLDTSNGSVVRKVVRF
jgi:uncharacterized lipoprotein YddW (UPF0748 family)